MFLAARSKQSRDFRKYPKSHILNSIGVNPTEFLVFSKYPCKTIGFTLYKNTISVVFEIKKKSIGVNPMENVVFSKYPQKTVGFTLIKKRTSIFWARAFEAVQRF